MELWRRGPLRVEKTDGNPESIARVCKNLIDDARETIFDGADRFPNGRLEYHVEVKEARLSVSSVQWFDQVLKSYGKEEAMDMALEFIREVRHHVPEQKKAAVVGQVSAPQYCKNYLECKFGVSCRDGHPEKPWCVKPVSSDDGFSVKCGQYYETALKIKQNLHYHYVARRELQRDLLVFPDVHTTNQAFVCDVDTWKELSEITATFQVSHIAFNFGRWESKQHQNPHAVDCHAHAHVILTHAGQQQIASKFPIFKYRTDPPDDYLVQDCVELEQQRVMGNQLLNLSDRLAEMQETQESQKQLIELIAQKLGISVPSKKRKDH